MPLALQDGGEGWIRGQIDATCSLGVQAIDDCSGSFQDKPVSAIMSIPSVMSRVLDVVLLGRGGSGPDMVHVQS